MTSVSPNVNRKPYKGSSPVSRRRNARSRSMPATATASGAITSAGQKPRPACWSRKYAMNAPSM